ncbi:YqeG family HAD IIIA-type phosphatase [Desertifilum sp. FACHB-1129]|uniref:Hydrolase n=2 Tax=Cyanophyceae TaxID=3028117 RepID=A0A1E5QLM9_9CYAN|nr:MULTISPECIES: YqeG family HAD IIIA-type phosphatase [Cyanophyceae]MCD8487407.1 YqeG family HAD IIIA-type phosphatase [Desertifilum sp.]MDA0208760.1 YqeG family HAD IIIA-type phosphatase [Cyanobacteria bacterium FC1]MDI9640309.1 YqeG family HAD IIIA-type phosphatase [Geitlerinema splendidum]MDK3159174.1 YqeG family HAD IIIA-type phosphatase [Kamptonema cortianum]MBD2310962.1 YqeG family HAD IIIA-type phosphatase [Desertifilum sp. FACHB-1129]
MTWNRHLQPDLVLGKPILYLTPEVLQHYHLKGLILDVDDTLVPIKSAQASSELQEWIKNIRSVAKLWLVSNNINQPRIRGIAEALDLPYIMGAGKPSRRKLRQAAQGMDLPPQQIAMVGDRLFTDVLAGNRLGLFTILVEPMVNPGAAASSSPLRSLEVMISQALGASLTPKEQIFTNRE